MIIEGRVVVDATTTEQWTSFAEDERITRLIKDAAYAPAGAEVEILVSTRQHPCLALDYLREHGAHLGTVTIVAPDPETVRRWTAALRNGSAVTAGW